MLREFESACVVITVNGSPVEASRFIETFVAEVARGIVASLVKHQRFHIFSISIKGEMTQVMVDGERVETNAFVNRLIKNTVFAMVGTLKGGDHIEWLRLDANC